MHVPPSSRPLGPIPGLFERQTINLLIGTSKSGKTPFLLNQLENYATGGGFLNRSAPPTGPVQMGMISCVGTETSVFYSLADFPFLSNQAQFPFELWRPEEESDWDNLVATFARLNSQLPADRPVRLLIVDDFQALMTSGKPTDIKAVKDFCRMIHQFCKKFDVTILGTNGNQKMKGLECYPQLADRIYGANCWAPEMSTLIGIERIKLHRQPELRPDTRRILVQTKKAPDEVHWGKFDEAGRLDVSPEYIPVEPENETEKYLDGKLAAAKPGTEFRVRDLERWGEEIKVSSRTVERWATQRTEQGLLKRVGHTNKLRYIKPLEQ